MKHKRVGEFGKKWDERVPRGQISWLINRLHVSVSDEEVAKDIRERCGKGANAAQFTEALIKQSIAYALECHHHNQQLYSDVVKGLI